MKNPHPAPLPKTLYVVTRERVRAGKPPLVLENPQYDAKDSWYVFANNPKFTYRIERCWPTVEQAIAEVKRMGQEEVATMQSRMSELQRKVRKARQATEALSDDSPSP